MRRIRDSETVGSTGLSAAPASSPASVACAVLDGSTSSSEMLGTMGDDVAEASRAARTSSRESPMVGGVVEDAVGQSCQPATESGTRQARLTRAQPFIISSARGLLLSNTPCPMRQTSWPLGGCRDHEPDRAWAGRSWVRGGGEVLWRILWWPVYRIRRTLRLDRCRVIAVIPWSEGHNGLSWGLSSCRILGWPGPRLARR